MQQAIQTEQLARELLDERKSKEARLSENNINLELNQEKQARKEGERKVNKLIDEKSFALKLDLAKEKKLREEAEERHYHNFGE